MPCRRAVGLVWRCWGSEVSVLQHDETEEGHTAWCLLFVLIRPGLSRLRSFGGVKVYFLHQRKGK